jgi:hypothetical protein
MIFLENGERGISNFTANLTQNSLLLQSVRLHWHVYYYRTYCSTEFATQLLKRREILRAEISKGTLGHKSDFRDQFEDM